MGDIWCFPKGEWVLQYFQASHNSHLFTFFNIISTQGCHFDIYCFPNILVRSTTIRDYIVSYLKEQVLVYQNQLSDGWTNSLNKAFSENSSLTTNGKRNAVDQLSPKCDRSFALSFLEFSYTYVTIQHEVSSVYFYRVDRSNILPSLRAWNCA